MNGVNLRKDNRFHIIKQYDTFFSNLVRHIPIELYYHTVNELDIIPKYFKNQRQNLTVEEKKERSKQFKKQKYQPFESLPAGIDKKIMENYTGSLLSGQEKGVKDESKSLQSLRDKLKEKISALKKARSSQKDFKINKVKKVDRRKSFQDKSLLSKSDNNQSLMSDLMITAEEEDDVNSTSIPDGLDFDYNPMVGAVATNSSSSGGITDKKHIVHPLQSQAASKTAAAGGKVRRIQNMLNDAEKKRERLEKLKELQRNQKMLKDTKNPEDIQKTEILEEGIKLIKNEMWSSALHNAANDKHDKPVLASDVLKLKKALKRRQKQKEKSANQWNDRIQNLNEKQTEKLKKREDNIMKRKGQTSHISKDLTNSGSEGEQKVKKRRRIYENDKKDDGGKEKGNNRSNGMDKKKKHEKKKRIGFEGKSTFLT